MIRIVFALGCAIAPLPGLPAQRPNPSALVSALALLGEGNEEKRDVRSSEARCRFSPPIFNHHFTPDCAAMSTHDSTKPDTYNPFELLRIELEVSEPEDVVLTSEAWILDVRSPRDTNKLLDWTRKNGLDRELRHLKRIRRIDTDPPRISILLAAKATPLPVLPDELAGLLAPQPDAPPDAPPAPYLTPVPARPALTIAHLALKNDIWPTVYAPERPDPDELRQVEWTPARRDWTQRCVRQLIEIARRAKDAGELPIAALLPEDWEPPSLSPSPSSTTSACVVTSTHDTRRSERHGLRHAVMNLVRLVGALQQNASLISPPASSPQEYLLTGRALFLTHEPCVMCAMALVHSRVRDVYVLRGMPLTGGCGLGPGSGDGDGDGTGRPAGSGWSWRSRISIIGIVSGVGLRRAMRLGR
ncbi:cytidine deaminase-like protein [Auriculariales sp. MPI-PUGE-AT-0066]|nr:cytidine deaminase-like protein [Auriculariales sp. MPI-PUGE-AT-0066]